MNKWTILHDPRHRVSGNLVKSYQALESVYCNAVEFPIQLELEFLFYNKYFIICLYYSGMKFIDNQNIPFNVLIINLKKSERKSLQ